MDRFFLVKGGRAVFKKRKGRKSAERGEGELADERKTEKKPRVSKGKGSLVSL